MQKIQRPTKPGPAPPAFRAHPWLRLLAVLTLLALGACGPRASSGEQLLTAAGSTSVQPFAEKLAEIYMELHPEKTINVQGGGSSAGIMAVITGASQIGMSSRELAAEERRQVSEFPIAWDGIAVIVHRDNPLEELSLEHVRAIFAGWVTNWNELGLRLDHEIDAISREEGSGTRNAFEHLVMKETEVSDGCLVQDSNGSVRELVATDPYAIGYISVGLVDERVKALTIDGVQPTAANIKSRHYRLTRPFLFLTRGEPQGSAKGFIAFVLGRAGQSALEHEGLVGVGPTSPGASGHEPSALN